MKWPVVGDRIRLTWAGQGVVESDVVSCYSKGGDTIAVLNEGINGRLSFNLGRDAMSWEYIINPDLVNHPGHYNNVGGVECIQVVEQFNFNKGNAIKYVWRAGNKGDEIEDLKKAAWYLQREIKRLEGENNG